MTSPDALAKNSPAETQVREPDKKSVKFSFFQLNAWPKQRQNSRGKNPGKTQPLKSASELSSQAANHGLFSQAADRSKLSVTPSLTVEDKVSNAVSRGSSKS